MVLDSEHAGGSGDEDRDEAGGATSRQEESGQADKRGASSDEPVVYRVQIASSSRKLPRNSSSFGPYRGEAKEMIIKNLYKYYVGEAASYKEALSLQSEVRRHVKGAFLVPFRGNEPIPMDEARRSER